MKVGLSDNQVKRISEISGNISVAWYSAGVIAPILLQEKKLNDFAFSVGFGLIMAGFYLFISLELQKNNKV